MVSLNVTKEKYANATLSYIQVIYRNQFREQKHLDFMYVETYGKESVRKKV